MRTFSFLVLSLAAFVICKDSVANAASCPARQDRVGTAEVRRECDEKTGQVTKEEWRVDGKLSRDNGPAVATVTHDKDGAMVVAQEWYLNGEPNPDGGPTLVHYDSATQLVDREEWRVDGKLSRDHGPALIVYDPNTGGAVKQEWYRNGKKQKAPE